METDVLYVSSLCSKRIELEVVAKAPESIGLQIQKYHRLLAKGFALNGKQTTVLSYNRAANNHAELPKNEIESGIAFNYVRTKKRAILSYPCVVLTAFIKTFSCLRKNKTCFVICDVLNLSVSLGAVIAGVLLRHRIIGIITDLPNDVIQNRKLNWIYGWVIKLCNAYVFLTENMRDSICTKGKKNIVLEGHVDSEIRRNEFELTNKWQGKHCIYAGGLHRRYGIEKLVKAFQKSSVDNAYLHIYGDGDYADELRKIQDESIIYHGIVTNEEVVSAEQQATLLINPRPTNEEFTKYSFPSKNMEYMASGTPVLTTNLPGMPMEYQKYVYLFDDETVEGMAKTLMEVLNTPWETLREKGEQAQRFVLEKKNNVVQASRIIEMIEDSGMKQ